MNIEITECYAVISMMSAAEIDLLLDVSAGGLWAIEIKRSIARKAEKGPGVARLIVKR